MQLENKEAFFVFNQIEEIKKIKGLPYLDFVFKLIDVKKILLPEIKAIQEKNETARKDLQALQVQYCQKDKDLKPVIINNQYQGLAMGINPEYDTASKEILSGINAISDEIHDYPELDKIKIAKKVLETSTVKENFSGDMYEAIQHFIE